MQGQDPLTNEYDPCVDRVTRDDELVGLPIADALDIKDLLQQSEKLRGAKATMGGGDHPCLFVVPDRQGENLLKSAELALLRAEKAVFPFKLNEELQAAISAKANASRLNKSNFSVVSVDAQISMLQEQIQKSGTLKYARAIKAVCQYATISEAVAGLPSLDLAWRAHYLSCAADNLAAFMSVIGNVYRGAPGNSVDLCCEENVQESAILKIVQIKDYLNTRISAMDTNQARRIQRVQEAKVQLCNKMQDEHLVELNCASDEISQEITSLGELLEELAKRTIDLLPNDAAIFFLSKKGTLLESAGDKGGTFLLAIDVIRLRESGLGPKGAGLYRFVGQESNIAAVVIVRPKYDSQGKPIELTRSKLNQRSYAKEIVEVLGCAPPIIVELKPGAPLEMQVKPGMSFGNLLKHFRAPTDRCCRKDTRGVSETSTGE